MSIRVLHVISHLGHRGVGQQILTLVRGLPREEFDLHVCAWSCCVAQRQAVEREDAPVTILGSSSSDNMSVHPRRHWPSHVWQLTRHISRMMPRLVQTWPGAGQPVATRIASTATRIATRMTGAAPIAVMSSCWVFDHSVKDLNATGPGSVDRRLERFSGCINARRRQHNSTRASNPPVARSVVVPMGVRAAPRPNWSHKRDLLQQFGLPTDAKLIVTSSDYSPQSRFKDAIWTADLLKVIRDDTHLVIIGNGPLLWRGRRFRDQVRIQDRVHLVTDCCQWDRWIPCADCFWDVDGDASSLPFTAAAMAHGVPVIAADTSASRDLLGETARYFAVGHRGGLARHCQELVEQPELSAALSTQVQERAKELLSLDRMIERYADIYRELANVGAEEMVETSGK